MKPKIFIDGEHGTTGLQIRSRLAERDDLEVISIPEAERRNKDLRADYLRSADIAILCLPDDASKEAVSLLEGHNSTRIIDTSTAHRVHSDWAYGFAELAKGQRERIAEARLVANPGCYPTGAIALVRPLRDAGLLAADYPISVNAVSGYTGGGKQMIAQMEDKNHPEHLAANNFLYGLPLRHKHVAELQLHGRLDRRPLFSPSVGRFPQGMIVQVPLFVTELEGSPSLNDIHKVLTEHYAGQNIVEVVSLEKSSQLPRVDAEELAGKDGMKLFVFGTEGDNQVNLVALLDNLGKGASGAAVQNMNLMLGKA
ncbi:N-acetyl-gamma-glutamyl-phosphate reductase [Ochrobactrum quorumnocens]|jgi:N-acetyl-gamma-glutamyl-phosphate reductase|uniref:N-acetyl-gamma-glutamyl-phosphate reductase n=1 Tax=Ochrobactrum quorumnocens TaxID=271865 RepID=A0A5N1JNQ1_9HYPH|nr:N-acetyl-gamma-glutamyl-phosphate reductase [[Ochrobactrum] quorumnocens]KAA9361229.1 N-acetyl-gamma-glutamyl-phosphate reductase [[Ochrobactrum] quorumnocens]MBD7992799.1 N-acetyl-gamma-glutamyl-phosphate reductase [Ochrobactrum gallinarum]